MVEEGEEELWKNQHYMPFIFKNDPGGILYQRAPVVNDCILDLWHPWEKVLYKNYFDTRYKRMEEAQAYYDSSFPHKGFGNLGISSPWTEYLKQCRMVNIG